MKKSHHLVWASRTAAALALLLPAAPCRADDAADRAAAEALYELGQKLVRDGNFAEACPKLEASNALDPGVGTLLSLGDCQEKWGRLASAWASFKDASALARAHGDSERVGIADLRAAALRPRLTYVLFRVSAENQVSGFELRRAGALIAQGSWGVPLPTDAGRYELVATAPEREAWHSLLEVPVKLDGPLIVTVPVLKTAGASPAPALAGPLAAPPVTREHPATEPKDEASSSGSGQRLLGLVSFGVGAVAGIVSGVLTYSAAKKNHDSKNECRQADANLCTPAGVHARDSAKSTATLATIVGIGGGVFAATGVTLFLTAPSSEDQHATGAVAGFKGRF